MIGSGDRGASPSAALPRGRLGELGQARDETQSLLSKREAGRAAAFREANLTIVQRSEPPTGAPSAERVRGATRKAAARGARVLLERSREQT
jgi:hypothetical protein